MLRASTIAALFLALSPASVSGAGTLASAPIFVKDGEIFSCLLVNPGAKVVRQAVAEVIRFPGSVPGVVLETSAPVDLEALDQTEAGITASGLASFYVCRFTFKGSGKDLRGVATVIDTSVNVLGSEAAR